MRTITLKDGQEWACNQEGEGVFSRRADGTWKQRTGTGQTPHFQTAQKFSRYIHANYEPNGERLPRMVNSAWWPTPK